MPAFCAYHNYKIGAYYVATFDLLQATTVTTTTTTTTTTSLPCVAIINRGDGDCNSGYWGVISRRQQQQQQQKNGKKKKYEVIVHIQSTGDMETTITQQSQADKDNDMSLSSWYATQDITFPVNKDEGNDEDERAYFEGLSPGICRTNLEKILGIAVHVIMASASQYWKRLPKTRRHE